MVLGSREISVNVRREDRAEAAIVPAQTRYFGIHRQTTQFVTDIDEMSAGGSDLSSPTTPQTVLMGRGVVPIGSRMERVRRL
jgi:hypothetical protein